MEYTPKPMLMILDHVVIEMPSSPPRVPRPPPVCPGAPARPAKRTHADIEEIVPLNLYEPRPFARLIVHPNQKTKHGHRNL